MYGLTRATTTLVAAGAAGLLIWLATQIDDGTRGGFWAVYGLIAGAGLVMALSQLLGGWTKWGWPRLALGFLLVAFVPIAIASLWIVFAAEPGSGWLHRHVVSWSGDIGIGGLVNDLKEFVAVIAFGIGLTFGFSFDTAGPRTRRVAADDRAAAPSRDADEPITRDRADEPVREGGFLQRDRQPVTPSGEPVDRTDDD